MGLCKSIVNMRERETKIEDGKVVSLKKNCGIVGCSSGFTLIELVFVVLIILVLAGISLPRLKKQFLHFELDGAAAQMAYCMDDAALRAKTEGDVFLLGIDREKKEYWVVRNSSDERMKTYRLPRSVGIDAEETEISFYPDAPVEESRVILCSAFECRDVVNAGVWGYAKVEVRP